jgi:hypothetical protein
MRNLSKLFILSLLFFVSTSYAIQVNVRSTSTKITALGFTVNGSKHGGLGSQFHARKMPKGLYSFGLRANGKDLACVEKAGKKKIKLLKNTNAVLDFNGKKCTVKFASE